MTLTKRFTTGRITINTPVDLTKAEVAKIRKYIKYLESINYLKKG